MSSNLQTVKQRFGIIGRSPVLDRALSTAIRVASTELTVMITGESGVGKEAFSNIIHQLSPRKHSKFIAINCGAIPEGTINSELFGHEKGAFTGANSDRKGYFETADGGTIFLDEIGEMPLDTQTYLLRVLETGEFIRVGSSKSQKTNVRIVAATNSDLMDKVHRGKFREDLYYRLNTVPIFVPPLRERREDIYLLFRKFAVDFSEKYRSKAVELDEQAKEILENYDWPGNIRELKNIAEQVSVLSTNRFVGREDLLQFIPTARRRNLPVVAPQNANGDSFAEREILYKLLFDMKKDLNDLKSLVFELIRNNNLTVPSLPEMTSLKSLTPTATPSFQPDPQPKADFGVKDKSARPIILDSGSEYKPSHEVEESLSLEDNEKDLITKALNKHKGKRKNAAAELGISERTLYRKIKYYNIKE